jgi:hypothetical protein
MARHKNCLKGLFQLLMNIDQPRFFAHHHQYIACRQQIIGIGNKRRGFFPPPA